MSQSTIFRGTFRFSFGRGGGGSLHFFNYNPNRPGVKIVLSTNAMIKSELNIQSLPRGKVK